MPVYVEKMSTDGLKKIMKMSTDWTKLHFTQKITTDKNRLL